MFFDWETVEIQEGYHDVIMPLVKLTEKSSLLFQEINLLLDTWTGEFLYNISDGIPYEDILSKQFDRTTLERLYFDKLSQLEYFNSMTDFTAQLNSNRELVVSFCAVSEKSEERIFTTVVLTDSQGNILTDATPNILVP